MLHWRLILGTVLVVALAGLCWLDHVSVPGTWLFPLAVVITVLASGEMLGLVAAGGARPIGGVVHAINLLMVLGAWLPSLWTGGTLLTSIPWTMLALAVGVLLIFLGEMRRYEKPGQVTRDMAAALFAMAYVGLLMSVLIRLRMDFGVGALVALVVVVKMGDIGAYTVGRLVGRHKMAPVLSPGKTWEGAAGAIVVATAGAWIALTWLVPWFSGIASFPAAWLFFGPMVAVVGILGDLAESLLKRDAGKKDSSTWFPGFGGVLDILDSILWAGPIVYLYWGITAATR